jgi:glycosyltransferase involved in cell wall biosynthesis
VIPNPLETASEVETWDETCSEDSLLYIGRFDKRKGGDLVLRVYAELAASYPRLKLTFVGPDRGIAGEDGKTIKFKEFVQSTVPASYQSRIDFLGQINHSDVMLLRRKHAVTIVASHYEPFGYVVLEAMSCGCPLVATAVGGIPELVHDRKNGLLVSPQDVHGMVAACSELLDDRALAARLGRQARQDCRQFYGPDDIAKRTVAAYDEAIEIFNRRKSSGDHLYTGR